MDPKVGYGSPPVHSRWEKGQSGNPKGRKKGSSNFETDLLNELGAAIQITEGGKTKRITKQQAVVKALLAKSMKGDVRAAAAIIALSAKHAAKSEVVTDAPLTAQEQAAFDALLDRHAALRPTKPTSNDGENK